MESAYKLAIEIVANAKNFETTINKAGGVTDDLADKVKDATGQNSKFTGSFSSIGAGIGKFLGIAGAAAGMIALVKSSMEAVEGPGDKLEAVVTGVKESMFELQRSVATMDFTSFFKNLTEGYEKGKKFADMMDDLKDKTAYSDYKVAGLKAQSAELAETIKNKQLDIAVRSQYAEDRKKIEEAIKDRTQELAEKAFLIEKQHWQDRNKMSTEEAVKLYETIDNLSREQADKLQKAFSHESSLFGEKEGSRRILSGEGSAGTLKGIPKEVISSYSEYLNLLRTGESDVLVKLFNTYKNIDQVRYESQRTYNLAVRETSMLLNNENTQLKRKIETLADLKVFNDQSADGYKLGTANIFHKNGPADERAGYANVKQLTMSPLLNNTLATPAGIDYLRKYNALKKDEIANVVKLATEDDILNSKMEKQKQIMDTFASSLKQGADSFKEYGKVVANSIREVVGALLAEAVATSITTALKSAKLAGPFGVFLIPALAAMGAGLAITAFNSLVPSFASGGIVSGPTSALVGEYPGARSNPEVIAPLSSLIGMLGGQQPVPQRMRLALDGQGNLYGYLNYRQRHLNNYR